MSAYTQEHVLSVYTPSGKASLHLGQKGRRFTVLAFEVEGKPDLDLAFAPDGAGVENLDGTSDIAQCFNLSNKVRYNGVTLSNQEMIANSFEELVYALQNVKLRAYNHEEI
jgi:hypothetical protein